MNIRSRSDLDKVKKAGLALLDPSKVSVHVGMSTCGLSAGAQAVHEAFRTELDRQQVDARLVSTGCLGFCRKEPLVEVRLPGAGTVLYAELPAEDVPAMVASLKQGAWPADHALAKTVENAGDRAAGDAMPPVPLLDELPFYARQDKVVLRNCGRTDPLSLEEYVACDGYAALAFALLDETPDRVIEKVTDSGLRGRGGGGFPTGRKWRICRDQEAPVRYVICNADEGDPGAYMDRTVLEGDPFSVIEGLTIAGYAIGASNGYVYVRDEYPLAVERMAHAIEQAGRSGLLGGDILGSGFGFSIHIVRGAGAFVCGEETALIASIQGDGPEPTAKPPYPAVSGLWGAPTVVNNVKTLASLPPIIHRGEAWFSEKGTPGNAGTVVFSLVGQVANTGLVEVPLGLTLTELLEGIGGGSVNADTPLKAVQTGGPSGGCIPAEKFDLPIAYETLASLGSIMGSGGMVVMDEKTCMVDVARYFTGFTRAESCGKCTPCREGTQAMHDILVRITEGNGQPQDLDLLYELGTWIKESALCGLGQTAPNPVLSTLNFFEEEYRAHVYEKFCPAGVCRGLIRLSISPDQCNGCGLCRRECPAGAISGRKKEPHTIDSEKCTRCKVCVDICPEGAIEIGRIEP